MPWLLQDRRHRPCRSVVIEFDCRDDPLSDTMLEVLEEDVRPALPRHRKRIGVEAMPGICDDIPRVAGKVSRRPDAVVVGISPSDMPMWSVAAEAVNSLGNGGC